MNVTKKNIPFSKIRVTGFNPRKNLKNDKIKKSIITDGFDPSFPLVVLECEDGFFDLIRGHCRHYIIGEIKVESPAVYKDKSLDKLPAVVYTGLSRSQVVEIMLDHQSDKDRKKLSILENACALKLYISEVNKKHTQESLSARFRVARTVIQKWQALNRWEVEHKDLFDAFMFAQENPTKSKIRSNDILSIDADLKDDTFSIAHWAEYGMSVSDKAKIDGMIEPITIVPEHDLRADMQSLSKADLLELAAEAYDARIGQLQVTDESEE